MKAALSQFAACAISLCAAAACAQPVDSYPTKPIRLIVPFPPGGTVDVNARILGPAVSSAIEIGRAHV